MTAVVAVLLGVTLWVVLATSTALALGSLISRHQRHADPTASVHPGARFASVRSPSAGKPASSGGT